MGEGVADLLAAADQVRGPLRGERDQHGQAKAAAYLTRGVHEPRRQPRLPLLGPLGRGDRGGHDRQGDPGRCQDPGDHHVHDRAAAGGDPGEQQQPDGHQDQAAAEYGPHPESAHQPSGAAGHDHDRQRHRQEHQAGVERRQTEDLLQVQRAEDPHREQGRAEQQHDRVGVLQRLAELLEGHQRGLRDASLDHAERDQQQRRRARSGRSPRTSSSPSGPLRRPRRRAPSARA